MNTENLSTLQIHKLTKEQYVRELENGNIDETALYLTPDETADLTIYATKEELNSNVSTLNTKITTEKTYSANTYQPKAVDVTKEGFKWTSYDKARYLMFYAIASGTINGKNICVAGGYNCMMYSKDKGVSWNPCTMPSSIYRISDIVYIEDASKFIAIDISGGIFGSSDGIDWGLLANKSVTLYGITYNPYKSMYVIACHGGIMYSTNGTTWTIKQLAGLTFRSVAYVRNGVFVAVGYDSSNYPIAYYSNDGITWSSSAAFSYEGALFKAAYVGGYTIAVGTGGVMLRTTDGVLWVGIGAELIDEAPTLRGICFNNSVGAMVVGDGGVAYRSTAANFTTWTKCDDILPNDLWGVTYLDDAFITCGIYTLAYTNEKTYVESENIVDIVTDHTTQIDELTTDLEAANADITELNTNLKAVAFSGSYNHLSNTPGLASTTANGFMSAYEYNHLANLNTRITIGESSSVTLDFSLHTGRRFLLSSHHGTLIGVTVYSSSLYVTNYVLGGDITVGSNGLYLTVTNAKTGTNYVTLH